MRPMGKESAVATENFLFGIKEAVLNSLNQDGSIPYGKLESAVLDFSEKIGVTSYSPQNELLIFDCMSKIIALVRGQYKPLVEVGSVPPINSEYFSLDLQERYARLLDEKYATGKTKEPLHKIILRIETKRRKREQQIGQKIKRFLKF